MATLKELTAEKHKEAETHPFVKLLFSGNIDPKFYATYLYNLHTCYNIVEGFAALNGLISELPAEFRRAPHIYADYEELWSEESSPKILKSTSEYLEYMNLLNDMNPKNVAAHIYVRHIGDLAGGQMISKKIPGSGRMYKFENPGLLRSKIMDLINVDMADEANRCFDFAIKTFNDMMELDIPKSTEKSE